MTDLMKDYHEEISDKITNLESLIERTPLLSVEPLIRDTANIPPQKPSDKKKVFIVYGHDESLLNQVKLFLTEVHLEPIVLRNEPNHGDTIMEKIEHNIKDVNYGIVLYTPDDKVYKTDKKEDNGKDTSKPTFRARQNVIFEHGYLIGQLGRNRVSALVKGDLETPGDIDGVVYTSIDKEGAWIYILSKEMNSVGYKIDLNEIK